MCSGVDESVKCRVEGDNSLNATSVDWFPFGNSATQATLMRVCYGDDCFIKGDIPTNKGEEKQRQQIEELIKDMGGEVIDVHPHGVFEHIHPLIHKRRRNGDLAFKRLVNELGKF